jgi:zinc/manganese transport system substrate-binding protein
MHGENLFLVCGDDYRRQQGSVVAGPDDTPEEPDVPRPTFAVLLVCTGLVLAGCATTPTATSTPAGSGNGGGAVVTVVAAENFWGSIATQLGGDKVAVTNIINSPDADPHAYEATTADGRAVATADMTITNGVGYDTWASDLTAANPSTTRTDLTIGDVVGAKPGDNPHRWYNPDDVAKVIDAITTDLQAKDPADTAYFDQQKTLFTGTALKDYTSAITSIRTTYAGTKVGASESIFAMLAPALGLDLITPPAFLTAITEGTDPTAADKATIDNQISTNQIKVYIYNTQNSTPDVQAQVDAAKAHNIPVSAITETLTPATATFQQWQTTQLHTLQVALQHAAG